ncbi:MAG: hypothetical protein ACK41T_07475 [Pseudobdellovibrio sp.]
MKTLFKVIMMCTLLICSNVFATNSLEAVEKVSLNNVNLELNPFFRNLSEVTSKDSGYAFIAKLKSPMLVKDQEYGQIGSVEAFTLRLTQAQYRLVRERIKNNEKVSLFGSVAMPESSIEVIGHAVLVVNSIR